MSNEYKLEDYDNNGNGNIPIVVCVEPATKKFVAFTNRKKIQYWHDKYTLFLLLCLRAPLCFLMEPSSVHVLPMICFFFCTR